MNYRGRLVAAGLVLVVLPMAALFGFLRMREGRLAVANVAAERARAESAFSRALDARARELDEQLAAVAAFLEQDDDFRLGTVLSVPEASGHVAGIAGRLHDLLGLDALWILDADGRVLSSGHFPAGRGSDEAQLRAAYGAAEDAPILLPVQRASDAFPALIRARTAVVGTRALSLLGGEEIDAAFLRSLLPDGPYAASLLVPGGILSTDPHAAAAPPADAAASLADRVDALTRALADSREIAGIEARYLAPRFSGYEARPARFLLTGPADAGRGAVGAVDGAVLLAAAVIVIGGAMLLAWASANLARLRAGNLALTDAERRAALGDLARQVNHDVKNAVAPIRNVVRHLIEVAQVDPGPTAEVLRERAPVLDAGLRHLESMAASYARLSPRLRRESIDAAEIAREVAAALTGPGKPRVRVHADAAGPRLHADRVAVRRILENLVRNGQESMGAMPGEVTVAVARAGTPEEPVVRFTVSDAGPGIAAADASRLFTDFYTTKPDGIGLGLSSVRRLVADHRGSVRVERAAEGGAAFTVDLPAGEDA